MIPFPAPIRFLLLFFPIVGIGSASSSAEDDRPNIVLILTDNHGAWTLGCYGNEDIRTPNLDRLATEGTLFSHAYAVNPVCSPTRASILTGLMPSQHGVMTPTDGPFMMGPKAYNLLGEFDSLPEILKENGYNCGLSGKWHLGKNMEPQEGLDDLWVTMPKGSTSTFYGAEIIENGEVRIEPQYMTDLWTDRAVGFIKEQTEKPGKRKPYFLYLAYNGPYGLAPLLLEPARNRHAEFYADHPLLSFPRVATRPWQFPNRAYVNNPAAFQRYASEVSGVDDGVGRVLKAIQESGTEKETLVIFTGDQGLGSGHNNLWGMGDHTRPLHLFDVTLRVPLIVRLPGKVAADQRVDELISQVDLFPTVLNLAGLQEKIPDTHPLPGKDLSEVLAGKQRADSKRAVFGDYENTRSIRTADWKLIERFDDGGKLGALDSYDELYDMKNDPGERINLYEEPEHEKTRNRLKGELDEFFGKYNLPKHDMWNGGESQTHNIVMGDYAAKRYKNLIETRGYPHNPFDLDFIPPPMTIPDGLAVEVAAAPPFVNHPVAGCLDDRGRLFLCENVGENLVAVDLEEKKQNKVTVLTDTNRDGIFDQVGTFADGLTFPQGCLWHEGALYVSSPPNIWKLEDTDDDGVADKRSTIATGFGYNGNAASVHTPRLSPTGRLFWGHGKKESEVKNIQGKTVHEGNTARIWTAYPDGRDLKTFCGGAMANPVELDFWKTGEVIGNVNILMRNPNRSDCLVHWQQGGVYPMYSNQAGLDEFTSTGELLREITDFGHVAVSGLTRYRSGEISPSPDDDWTDNFFMTLFNSQELVRLRIERDGSSFRSVTHPFLTIHDPGVHLVGVLEDADGSLLLIDTGGWFRQGCPASGVAKPDIAGAVYRIRKSGPYDRETDWRGTSIDWDTSSPEHLAALLDDPRFSVREKAAASLAAKKEKSVESLAGIAASHPDPDTRIEAVFSLSRNPSAKSLQPIRTALRDRDPEVRIAAANAAGERRDKAAVSFLLKNLHHASEALQRESATALGNIGASTAIPALVNKLRESPLDRRREHAVIRALLDIGDEKATEEAFEKGESLYGENPDFIRRRLIVRNGLEGSVVGAGEVSPYLFHEDEKLRTVALSVFCGLEDRSGRSLPALKWFSENPNADHFATVESLLSDGLTEADPAINELLGSYLSHQDSTVRRVGLSALAGASKPEVHESWIPPLRSLLLSDEVTAALKAVARFSPQPFEKEIGEIGSDEARSDPVRIQALQISQGDGKVFSDDAFDLLANILSDPESTPGERMEACQLLDSGPRLTKTQKSRAAELMLKAGPLEFPIFFANVRAPKNDTGMGADIVEAYLNAPGASAIPAGERKRILIATFQPDFWDEPVAELEKQIAAERDVVRRVDHFVAQVTNGKGDAERGKAVAASTKATCMVCHTIGDSGNHVGPDLSKIGQIRQPADLVESILMPSASLAQDYEAYAAKLKDGTMAIGVIKSESTDSIDMTLPTGQSQTIARSDIESLDQLPISLMPAGLDHALGEQDMIDLITYLGTLR